MSLFGSYIQESTEVLEESYYTEYDFLTESFNTAFDEFEQFHSFLTEKVDVKAGAKKFAAVIKGAVGKLIKMIRELGAKIRELVGRIFKSSKAVKEKAQKIKKLSNREIKKAKVLDMSKPLEMTIENVKGVDSLHFYFNYGSNGSYSKAGNDDNANGAIMVKFKEIDTRDKAIVEETPGNLHALGDALLKSQNKLDGVRGKLQAIEQDGKKAEAKAAEIGKLADKLDFEGVAQAAGDRTSGESDAGIEKAFNAQDMRKDVALLTAYVSGCNKIAGYVSEIETNLNGLAARYAATVPAEKKEETA